MPISWSSGHWVGHCLPPQSPALCCFHSSQGCDSWQSVTRRGRGCAVWEHTLGTFRQPRGRERNKCKCTGGGGGGAKRDTLLQSPFLILSAFSSYHFSSSLQLTFISLCYSSQNREPKHLSPFLSTWIVFSCASSSTTVGFLDIWVC